MQAGPHSARAPQDGSIGRMEDDARPLRVGRTCCCGGGKRQDRGRGGVRRGRERRPLRGPHGLGVPRLWSTHRVRTSPFTLQSQRQIPKNPIINTKRRFREAWKTGESWEGGPYKASITAGTARARPTAAAGRQSTAAQAAQ